MISQNTTRKKSKKPIIIIIGIVLFFVATLIGCNIWYKSAIEKPNSQNAETKAFVIEKGEGGGDIIAKLRKEQLTQSHLAFLIYLNINRMNSKLQAGEYQIPQNLNIKQLAELLTKGQINSDKLTIPEGWTLEQIAEKVEKDFGIPKNEFVAEAKFSNYDIPSYFTGIEKTDSMEGFLYPATYEIPENPTAGDIVGRMFDTFKKKYTENIQKQITTKGLTTYEAVTLASIVEREVAKAEDRKMVAGVFLNRLDIKMPLESCATIQYITGTNKSQFTYEETRISSPYNTYINRGLPKGPIGNPSIESINAVIAPTESDYLYFLSANGVTYFSETLDEHNAKKAQYLD